MAIIFGLALRLQEKKMTGEIILKHSPIVKEPTILPENKPNQKDQDKDRKDLEGFWSFGRFSSHPKEVQIEIKPPVWSRDD